MAPPDSGEGPEIAEACPLSAGIGRGMTESGIILA